MVSRTRRGRRRAADADGERDPRGHGVRAVAEQAVAALRGRERAPRCLADLSGRPRAARRRCRPGRLREDRLEGRPRSVHGGIQTVLRRARRCVGRSHACGSHLDGAPQTDRTACVESDPLARVRVVAAGGRPRTRIGYRHTDVDAPARRRMRGGCRVRGDVADRTSAREAGYSSNDARRDRSASSPSPRDVR